VAAGRYYVDTSAYLCVLLGEAGWEQIARQLDRAQLLASSRLALEAERTLAHLRTALWFHQREPITRFVSRDTAQTQAARELGLPL